MTCSDCHDTLRRKVVVTEEVREQRLSICASCEHYKKTLRVCGKCLCFMPAKTYLAGSSCPLNPPKWESTKNKTEIKVVSLDPGEALPVGSDHSTIRDQYLGNEYNEGNENGK